MTPGRILIPLLFLAGPCHAAAPCAETIRELRALLGDPSFPLLWRETSMDDGKPLVLSILEKDGTLFLTFTKTDEGLWAEGASSVCAKGLHLEARFPADKLTVGPAAHWAMRYTLSSGADFTLTRVGADRMKIEVGRWNGLFAARERD